MELGRSEDTRIEEFFLDEEEKARYFGDAFEAECADAVSSLLLSETILLQDALTGKHLLFDAGVMKKHFERVERLFRFAVGALVQAGFMADRCVRYKALYEVGQYVFGCYCEAYARDREEWYGLFCDFLAVSHIQGNYDLEYGRCYDVYLEDSERDGGLCYDYERVSG